jgi:SPP1 gp7 family putative phage head morphogenesis protein
MIKHLAKVSGRRFFKRVERKLKPIKPSRVSEAAYKSDLLSLTNKLQLAGKELSRYLDSLRVEVDYVIGDSREDDIRKKIKDQARKFNLDETSVNKTARMAVNRVKRDVDDKLRAELRRSVKVDIDPIIRNDYRISPQIEMAVTENVALIKSIPEQYFAKLEKHVLDAMVSGQRHDSFTEIVERVGKITENRAKVIARDQISKLNGSFNRIRQSTLGIDEYIWSTSQDERVRPTHQENEGKKFRWDSPPEETGHPGEDVMCRCVAIPVFDLDSMEEQVANSANNEVLYNHEGTNWTSTLATQYIAKSVKTPDAVMAHDTAQLEMVLKALRKHDIYDPDSVEITEISIKDLKTVQSVVRTDQISSMAGNFDSNHKPVTVWKLPNGEMILRDGNHRVNSAIKNNKLTIKAKVLSFK